MSLIKPKFIPNNAKPERVQTMINILERTKQFNGKFNLSWWQDINYDENEQAGVTEEELHTCGTAACIAGWLAVSPEFIEAGGRASRVGGCPHIKDPESGKSYGGVDAFTYFIFGQKFETFSEPDNYVRELLGFVLGLYRVDLGNQETALLDTDDVTIDMAIQQLKWLLEEATNDYTQNA